MKSVIKFLPVIGILLFILIIGRTGFTEIFQVLRDADPRILYIGPAFAILIIVLKTWKWQKILQACGVHYSFFPALRAWSIASFAGFLTPAKAGDAVRAYYLKRDTNNPLSVGLASLFIDRLFDLLGLLIFVAISIVLMLYMENTNFRFEVIMIVFIVAGVATYLATKEKLVRMILRPFFHAFIPTRFHTGFRTFFSRFYHSINTAKQRKRYLLYSFIINLAGWGILMLYTYMLARSIKLPVTLVEILLIMPLVGCAELLPISVSGLGTREAAMIAFFQLFAIPVSFAVPFSLLYFVFAVLLIDAAGLVFLPFEPVALRRVSKMLR